MYWICCCSWDVNTKVVEPAKDEDASSNPHPHLQLAAEVRKTVFVSKFAASKLVVSEDGHHLGVGVADGHVVVFRADGYKQVRHSIVVCCVFLLIMKGYLNRLLIFLAMISLLLGWDLHLHTSPRD